MTREGRRLATALLLAPALLWLGALVVVPQLDLVRISFLARGPAGWELSGRNYTEFFQEPLYWLTFLRTALFSVITTLVTLVVSFPIAWYIAKLTRGRAKTTLFFLCLVPFWASEVVRTLGWLILLRESGVISHLLQWLGLADRPVEMLYTDASMVVGLVYSGVLFMLVPLVNAFDSLDDGLIEAAYDLGGRPPSILAEIVVPHAKAGITSGCIVVFMLTLGNYVTATVLGGKNSLWFTEQLYNQFIVRFNWEVGSALGVLLLVLSSAMVWLGLKLTGQSLGQTVGS